MEELLIKVIIGMSAVLFALLSFIGTVFYQKLGKLTEVIDSRLAKITEKLSLIEKDFNVELAQLDKRISMVEHIAGINMHVCDTGGISFQQTRRTTDGKVP